MRKFKQLSSIILAVLMLLPCMVWSAGAAGTVTIDTANTVGTYVNVGSISTSVARFSDYSATYFTTLPDIFGENNVYLQPTAAEATNATWNGATATWLTFSIDQPANVYILVNSSITTSYLKWIDTEGYQVLAEDGVSWASASSAGYYGKNEGTGLSSANRNTIFKIFKKTFEPGTITMKTFGYTQTSNHVRPYGVVVDFIEAGEEEILPIDNVLYNGTDVTSTNLITPVTDGLTRWTDFQETLTFGDGISFSNDSYFIKSNYKDYNIKPYIEVAKEWMSFEITQPAKVYVVSNMAVSRSSGWLTWMLDEGWKAVGTDGSLIDPSSSAADKYQITTSYTGNSGPRKMAFLYTKTFIPAEGEPLKISLKGTGYENSSYLTYNVIVDFDENISIPETISTYPNPFTSHLSGATIEDYACWALAFATAPDLYGLRGEFGMLVSETANSLATLTVGADGVEKLPAKKVSSTGNFGLLVGGDEFFCEKTFYARAYAYYNGEIVYGDSIITINDVVGE